MINGDIMKINRKIIEELSKKYNAPILDLWNDGVIFEQYICVLGKHRICDFDELIEEIEEYENVVSIDDEVYPDDVLELDNTYFEQVSVYWEE